MNNNQVIELIEEYADAKELSCNTVKLYKKTLNKLIDFCKGKNIVELKPLDLNKFLKNRKDETSVSTSNSDLRNLKSIYSVLAENDVCNNIAKNIKPFADNRDKPEDDFLQLTEVKKVLSVCRKESSKEDKSQKEIGKAKQDYIYLLVMFYTGMRCSEVANLKGSDVVLENGILEVTARETKNRKDFTTYIVNKKAVSEISNWISERNVGEDEFLFVNSKGNLAYRSDGANSVQKMFQSYLEKAKVNRKLGCHATRKTFATYLRDKGVDVYDIEQLLNHSVNSLGANVYARLTKDKKIKILSMIKY